MTQAQLLEAARYAVLRRMSSALRHQIAGSLQPVNMIASMVQRRTQMDEPDLVVLRKNCSEMSALSRKASAECTALIGWLAPLEGEQAAIDAAVKDCLDLLATEFSFRGFSVVNSLKESEPLVSRTAVRTVLPAALMALTDAAVQPLQLHLSADTAASMVTLSIGVQPYVQERYAGDRVFDPSKVSRIVSWQEVELLAEAESVKIGTRPDGSVDLMFPVRPQ